MKKSVIAIALISVSLLSACGGDAEQDATNHQTPTETYGADQQMAPGVQLETTSGESIVPTDANLGSNVATPAEGVKLNPPHGQPGHRCEIPVGAPLDSDPSNMIQQQMVQDHVQPSAPQSQPGAGSQGVRLNPPHGQPGHDCAVAVGAPLP
jgi:hypothetical protein